MRSLSKLVMRCLLGAAGFVMALLVILTSILMGVGLHEYRNYPYSDYSVGIVAEALQTTKDGYGLEPSHTTEEWLDGYEWAMQLDEEGEVIWQWDLPAELNRRYSVPDAALFSRWYLDQYPVFVWRNDYGLMVLAKPRDSVWRYNFYSTPDAVAVAMASAIKAMLFVLCAALLVCGILMWRFWRNLQAIGAGIDALARGEPVTVQASGVTSELADSLNKTGTLLRGQNEALSRRDAARTNWIAGVSHDIRTPLSLIAGYAESLEDEELGGKINGQVQRIKSLVEDLNLTSKLQYNAQPLRRKAVQAGALLRRAAADFCNSALSRRCTLDFQLERGVGQSMLDGDEALLTRAIENLLNNAARHNPGGCRVTLCAEQEGDCLCVTVSDDGTGYPPEVLRALRTGETGENTPHILGLHLVEQIAAAHGGGAEFCRNLPHGARAVLTLPVIRKNGEGP